MNDSFDPQVGDHCHWTLYTDAEPCTVIARTPATATVRIDRSVIIKPPEIVPGGFAGVLVQEPEYQITEDPNGRKLVFTRRKNDRWKLQKTATTARGNDLRPGWFKRYDYGF